MTFREKSYREFKVAIRNLYENPDTHGYSENEKLELITMEKELTENSNHIHDNIDSISKTINDGVDALISMLEVPYNTSMNKIKQFVSKGWYMSPAVFGDISFDKLESLTNTENLREFEKYIENKFSKIKSVNSIIDLIIKEYPCRLQLLEEIKNLFKKKFYYAIVPLCYSQADGICNEKFRFGFFDTDKKDSYNLKVTKRVEENLSQKISEQILEPKNEITKNSRDLDTKTWTASINRHLIMHGHSYMYGNKKNALRAILLLEFVCWFTKQSSKSNDI